MVNKDYISIQNKIKINKNNFKKNIYSIGTRSSIGLLLFLSFVCYIYNNQHTKNIKHTISQHNQNKTSLMTHKPQERWKYIEILQYPENKKYAKHSINISP